VTAYVAVEPGTKILVVPYYSFDYETMCGEAIKHGGTVTTCGWYQRKFGIDPSMTLKPHPAGVGKGEKTHSAYNQSLYRCGLPRLAGEAA
jgi:predicted 3-demethylubiquinone-9 3-methyltransferase (glyoxalase superfamily)